VLLSPAIQSINRTFNILGHELLEFDEIGDLVLSKQFHADEIIALAGHHYMHWRALLRQISFAEEAGLPRADVFEVARKLLAASIDLTSAQNWPTVSALLDRLSLRHWRLGQLTLFVVYLERIYSQLHSIFERDPSLISPLEEWERNSPAELEFLMQAA